MSVWQNRGTWRWRVMRRGRIAQGSARSREAARDAESAARRALIAGEAPDTRRTLAAAIVEYLRSPQFLALKSAHSTADKLAQWESYIHAQDIAAAPDIARQAVADWLGKGLAVATINRRLAALRRVLALAYRDWQWTRDNLAARIRLLPGEAQRQVWLTRAEAIRLRRACPRGHVRAAVSLLLATGLRVGELLALRADQIRDGAIFLDARTKTGRPRAVPILYPGARYVKAIPIALTYDGLRTAFDKAKRRAGLPHVRLHDLRHTVGSQLAEAGASLRDIQVWLGHTSPTTTTRYTHVELGRLRAVASQMDARKMRANTSANQPPETREQRHDAPQGCRLTRCFDWCPERESNPYSFSAEGF